MTFRTPSPSEKSPLDWKNILAPTDFSGTSIHAVRIAIRLAGQCGAKITLLHVVHLPASYPTEAPLDVDKIMNASREPLDEISRGIPSELLHETLLRFGAEGTVQKINEVARGISADLIVIATHGCGPLKRVLLGSTAEKVVRHAPCPVLVVREKENSSGSSCKQPKEPLNPHSPDGV